MLLCPEMENENIVTYDLVTDLQSSTRAPKNMCNCNDQALLLILYSLNYPVMLFLRIELVNQITVLSEISLKSLSTAIG